MKFKHLRLIFLLLLIEISFFNVEISGQNRPVSLFYYVDGAENFQDFKNHLDKIDILAPSAYFFDEDGLIWGSVDKRIIALAKENNIKVMPLIVNYKFNQKHLHNFLNNSEAKKIFKETLAELCKQNSYYGIQFDVENLNLNDKDNFTKLYKETADSLHKYGVKISAAVVHNLGMFNIPTQYFKWLYENWRGGYDLEKLGEVSDFISIMTYSQHTRRTTPGPNAGFPWVTKVLDYVLKFIKPEKISLGIPFKSKHWFTDLDTANYFANARSWSEAMDYKDAKDLADRNNAEIEWDSKQKVSYTIFVNGGLNEYIFFEDAKSFNAKYQLINKFNLHGFSAWVLGSEDSKVWDLLPAR